VPKKSAGILFYRFQANALEILLVHPGGPFWTKKDLGVWSIPKGEIEEKEIPLEAAIREVFEEIGVGAGSNFIELTPIKQKGGKIVYAWAAEGNFDVAEIKSNKFEMEWPPKSGIKKEFPEIDKAEWFGIDKAKTKIIESQTTWIDELKNILNAER